jgi:hypothetical protein
MYIGFHVKYTLSSALMKIDLPRHIFEKRSNIKFHENPSSRSRRSDEQTGRHDETNSPFLKFCERA